MTDTVGGKRQTGKYKIDARFNKVALADKIRNDLKEQGILLEDGPSGTTWKIA